MKQFSLYLRNDAPFYTSHCLIISNHHFFKTQLDLPSVLGEAGRFQHCKIPDLQSPP